MPNKESLQKDYCKQEARLMAIETKLANKKENITEIHEDYYHLRDKLEQISLNVAELTAILKENTRKEDENDRKIDELTLELAKANMEIGKINSSLETLKWIIPIACTVLTFLVNYLI